MLRLLQPAWLSAWLISLISGVGGAEIPLTSLNDSKVRAWIITAEYEHAIHRFFDSSPISPSNQFLATTTLPSFAASASASPLTTSYKQASIQVTDITSGATTLVDLTDAWDSQLGAQVQWGATDSELYYNVLQNVGANVPADASTPHPHQSNGCSVVRGVRLNMLTRQKTLLQCPVYHVSNDGKLAAAPNLLKIHHTQKGYGVRVLDTTAQKEHVRGAAHGDGLYITNTVTGECRLLVSLHRLAQAAGMDTEHTPMYGFHTKFSSDGSLIMFVVRTMEQPVAPRKGLVRVQHLFVVSASGTTVRRMVSWASYPFVPARCHSAENVDSNNNGRVNSSSSTSASKCSPVHLRDGNHPNWVPHAHRISMNLQKYKPKGQPQPSTAEDVLSSVSRLVNLQPTVRESEWNIVSFDVEAHADNFIFHDHHPVRVVCDFTRRNHTHQCLLRESSTRQNTASAESELPHGLGSERQLLINVDHDKGSGHPIYHPSGKYIVTDAYLKEAQVLHKQGSAAHNGDTVPLRLIEIATQREVQLLQVTPYCPK